MGAKLTLVLKIEQHLDVDSNFDHHMSLCKGKFWYSDNCLHFSKRTVPLLDDQMTQLIIMLIKHCVCQMSVGQIYVGQILLAKFCWPNVCWPNVCWTNVCWPYVCWTNVCQPNVC